jgi:hypothetical protein
MPITYVNLTTSKDGKGSGTVSGAGYCGTTSCQTSVPMGTTVTLTATPDAYSATRWSRVNCLEGNNTGNRCTIVLTADTKVTATFDHPIVGLKVVKSGQGSGTVTSSPAGIDCGSTCQADITSGSIVTLTATPANGSVFSGWSGVACIGGFGNQCQVKLSAAATVTAVFDPTPVCNGPTLLGCDEAAGYCVCVDCANNEYLCLP